MLIVVITYTDNAMLSYLSLSSSTAY